MNMDEFWLSGYGPELEDAWAECDEFEEIEE